MDLWTSALRISCRLPTSSNLDVHSLRAFAVFQGPPRSSAMAQALDPLDLEERNFFEIIDHVRIYTILAKLYSSCEPIPRYTSIW